MRLKLSVLFTVILNVSLAQESITITGTINDEETKEPISFAHIYLNETFTGTTSNVKGGFVLKITLAESTSPVLVVSSVGYENKYIRIDQSLKENFVISMKPIAMQMEEVVVSPIEPAVIIDSVIARIPLNYYSDSYSAKGFQREYVKADENYIQLLEVAFSTFGNASLQESEVLKARFIEDKEEKEPLWDPSRGGFYTFGWTQISGIEHPAQQRFLGLELDKKNSIHKYYDFEFQNEIKLDDEEVFVI